MGRKVERQQLNQKITHDNTKEVRKLREGDKMYVEMFVSTFQSTEIGTFNGPL